MFRHCRISPETCGGTIKRHSEDGHVPNIAGVTEFVHAKALFLGQQQSRGYRSTPLNSSGVLFAFCFVYNGDDF